MKSFFESNITAKEWLNEGSIPQEHIKRGWVRDEVTRSSYPQALKLLQVNDNDLVAWFANKYNLAEGWTIWKANDYDKKEFGQHVFRTYNESKNSTSIIQFNILKGTYAFIDNEAYLNDEIKFQKMTAYDRLIIEPTDIAYEEFNIV